MTPTSASTTTEDLLARHGKAVMQTYGEASQAFVRGDGVALFDPEGRPYLDFLCGLAVTSLGHAHPAVTAAVAEQAATLVHTSNLFVTPPAVELAERLAGITGWEDARTFFANCGATANEAALKLARRHGKRQHPGKVRVVTLAGSFHGRTFATLEATGQAAKHAPFEPLLGTVDTVPFDDPAALRAAVAEQAATLVHTSNLFVTPPAVELAERLARITGWEDARTFFANCGATANEAALKLARRHGKRQHPGKVRVVTLAGSFHGRTFATLEATGQAAKHAPFEPLLGVVDTVPFDDPAALRAAVGMDTCAVLLECIQGEGGVRPVPDEVLVAAREACDEVGALLIVDEVQTGIGRTGPWFAFQASPVVPDVITVAKALANGLPIGACIARGVAAEALTRGEHASTFGGNPVTCAAANAVIATIERDGLLAHAGRLSELLVSGIEELAGTVPLVRGIRGRGLLLGVELASPVAAAVEAACRERFLLVNAVAPDVLRLAPPLIASEQDIALALAALREALVAVAGTDGRSAAGATRAGQETA